MSEESRKTKFMQYVTLKNLLTNGKGIVIYPARMLQPKVWDWISGSAHNLSFEL